MVQKKHWIAKPTNIIRNWFQIFIKNNISSENLIKALGNELAYYIYFGFPFSA